MRVILVGSPAATRELREILEASGVEVTGEVRSLDDIPNDESLDIVVVEASREQDEDEEGDGTPDDESAPIEPLTPREREVLQLLSEGLPNKAIAVRLGLSDHTVKFHLSSIFGKLGVTTRTEAVRRAVRAGLINF